jgi:hypothetical protein
LVCELSRLAGEVRGGDEDAFPRSPPGGSAPTILRLRSGQALHAREKLVINPCGENVVLQFVHETGLCGCGPSPTGFRRRKPRANALLGLAGDVPKLSQKFRWPDDNERSPAFCE